MTKIRTAKQTLIGAYGKDKQEKEIKEKARALKFGARAKKAAIELGLDLDDCTITFISWYKCLLTWPGLELQATTTYGNIGFAVYGGTCPHCKKDIWSYPYSSAAQIGERIVNFAPSHIQHCNPLSSDDPLDRLVELLREILELE